MASTQHRATNAARTQRYADARETAALVPMARLLETLGFTVNTRTRRSKCVLHKGSNPSEFAWRHDGLWYCFSCGQGGDRIALVMAARQCNFREAVAMLAQMAGVKATFRSRGTVRRASPAAARRKQRQRTRAEAAAWRIADESARLLRHYTDALHRTERLQRRTGEELLRARMPDERDAAWDRLARLACVSTYFLAAWNFLWDATPEALARFALAAPADRRRFILEGSPHHE